MKKLRGLFILLLLCCYHFSAAQQPPKVPRVVIKEGKKHTNLGISALSVDIEVIGNIAVTTLDMTFYNDEDRILEGELNFPLGEGQTVSRFAMDVNGKLREGVVVEKEEGRKVFESIVRRRVDPGLLEMTKGNNFKARVYPIPPKGNKRLLVAYEQELRWSKNGYVYHLPLDFQHKLSEFKAKIEVLQQTVEPDIEQGGIENLMFKNWRNSYLAEVEKKDYQLDSYIGFTVPFSRQESSTFIDKKDGQTYFYTHLNVDAPEVKRKDFPKKVALLWDASASSAQKDIDKELKVLDAYFKKCNTFQLVWTTFSANMEKTVTYNVKKGNWDSVKAKIKETVYDGGTQLGTLPLSSLKVDEIIISTDGLSNFGKKELDKAHLKTPLIILNSQAKADHDYLNFLALQTGGKYLNLHKMSTEIANERLLKQTYKLLKITYDSDKAEEVQPSIPTEIYNNLTVAGTLKANKATLKLHFGMGNKVKEVKEIQVSTSDTESHLASRMWAQKKLAFLNLRYKENKEEITAIGKAFSIVTKNTSLIVLDAVEDYVQHEITPPDELKETYAQLLAEKKAREEKQNLTEKEQQYAHIENVVNTYNNYNSWWEKAFPKDKPKLVNEAKKAAEERRAAMATQQIQRDSQRRPLEAAGAMEVEEEVEEDGGWGSDSGDGSSGDDWGSGSDDSADGWGAPEDSEVDGVIAVSAPRQRAKRERGTASNQKTATIQIKEWDPKAVYINVLSKLEKDHYTVYQSFKEDYGTAPSFYLDVAEFFKRRGEQETAYRVLSNLSELALENHELLRIMGHRLLQLGYLDEAIATFEEVKEIRGEEPQSYRDLALAYEAAKNYQKAVDLLYEVVTKRSWDGRFSGVESIALNEMNAIIAIHKSKLDISNIDNRLIKSLPVDIRVVLDWSNDNTDMDLWVVDPYGEKCYYSHKLTYIGGRMSNDLTQGYGPEEFVLKDAVSGTYTIKVNYYGSSRQNLSGAVTLQATIFTFYGTKQVKKEAITLKLDTAKQVVEVGTFTFDGGKS